jgi:predicted amino acid racemase
MYLDALAEKNPGLLTSAARLHAEDALPANTYVVDLDAIRHNASAMAQEARRVGIRLYLMTKHYNRNPLVTGVALDAGIDSTVCVETADALYLSRFGLPVGHVGHLVQIPRGHIQAVLETRPEIMTIFSVEKALQVSSVATKLGMVQDIIFRVRGRDDLIYPNEEGGIWEDELEAAARKVADYPGVRIVGVTVFPATLFRPSTARVEATANFAVLTRCAQKLTDMGFEISHINAPGASSTIGFQVVAESGGTEAEPGHAVTGTTPQVLYPAANSPERPAIIYLNEVSHLFESRGYVYGGGFYACDTGAERGDDSAYHGMAWEPHAFVGRDPAKIVEQKVPVDKNSFFGRADNATDYYGGTLLPTPDADIRVGDTVIYGFRPQVFTTRANVAVIDNVDGDARLLGIFDRALNLLDDRGYPRPDTVECVRDRLNELLDRNTLVS